MAGNHLLLLARGGYNVSGMGDEIWQFGTRWNLDNSASPTDTGTLTTNYSATAENVSRVETDWSINGTFKATAALANTINIDDWLNDQVAPSFVANFASVYLNISDQVELRELHVAMIGGDGSTLSTSYGPATMTLTFDTPVAGGRTGDMLPPECAVVASLRTPNTSARGRGRCYLPPVGVGVLDTEAGAISSTETANIAARFAVLLDEASYDRTTPDDAHVYPIITGKTSPAWTNYYRVTTVRVGNVMDAQRRRRNQLVETYASYSV